MSDSGVQPLRVGFIGAGANTRLRHLPGFAAIPGVELAAVANRTEASASRVATDFNIARTAGDWREIIANSSIDAVCIGTWPDTHAEMTCAALAAGKHVLVEARMARTLADAEAMMAAAQAHPDRVTQTVPSPLTLAADELVGEYLREGRIGDIREVVVEHATAANLDPDAPLTWRQDETISGINTMAFGICFEALQRWFEDNPEVVAADAHIHTPMRRDAAGEEREVRIPDSLTVLGRWKTGARLVMHHSGVEPGANRCTFRLVGSKATLLFDAVAQQLSLIPSQGPAETIPLPRSLDECWAVEAQFVESIRQGTPVRLTDFASGLRYMQFTHEVIEACRQNPTQ
jgi:predicted dehydrogenase